MAPRGRATVASAHDDHYDSSPDPLAASFNNNTFAKPRRAATPREPLRTTSPSKQNQAFSVPDFELSSPAKSMIMSTPRVGSASPWRIKVTVQAEPGSDENADSPSVKRVTRTKTTTVPLKDHDAQTPAKRPRGRPRKSDIGVPAKPKRNGTPLRKPARSKSRDPSVGATADVDTDAPPKRRRGRPRKNVQPHTEDDVTLVVPELDDEEMIIAETISTRQSTSTSKKSARDVTPELPNSGADTMSRMRTNNTPSLDMNSTPTSKTNQQVRVRRGTPHAKGMVPVSISSDEESDADDGVLTPTSGGEGRYQGQLAQDVISQGYHDIATEESTDEGLDEQFTAEDEQFIAEEIDAEVLAYPASDQDEEEGIQDVTNFAFEEGATRMPDDTTVLDSENFSMISVDSLPSNGGPGSSPLGQQQDVAPRSIDSLLQHEYLQPLAGIIPRSTHQTVNVQLRGGSKIGPEASSIVHTPSTASPRYKTPAIDVEVPSAPPAIEPAPPSPTKSEPAELDRAVTAGVALQGLLDPSRITPKPSQRVIDEERDRLQDLFRGFSDGTRRELQAGLRLGEQLAEGHTKEPLPSATNTHPEAAPKEGVFRTQRKYRSSRLLTPEDQHDHVITPDPRPTTNDEVQYPSLVVENALLSPESSEDEMSWRVDTPPVKRTIAIENTSEGVDQQNMSQVPITEESKAHQEDYGDIWQEEASRSSNSPETEEVPVQASPQLEDIFVDDGPIVPARGKLPRTWRRKSSNHFQYSDEAESPSQATPEIVEGQPSPGKAFLAANNQKDDEGDWSEASDDTGMFFQANIPNVFNKQRSAERSSRKRDKLSLSSLLEQGESLIPESSPPVETKKLSSPTKTNPFLGTPPRFPGFPCSPSKSSPLRREIRGSDISSDSPQRIEDESSLPLPQSSPFRTIVDGDSMVSTASDQRQFRVEMEGSTASSIQRVREEANEYLDAYEAQDRSLEGITEVTEPSRTWHKERDAIASSPPQRKQILSQSLLSPTRKPVPLFRTHNMTTQAVPSKLSQEHSLEETDESSVGEDTEASSVASAEPSATLAPVKEIRIAQTGKPSRVTATFSGGFTRVASPSPHPILSRVTPLPKIEPWTKTHYKALDKLYTTHLKHPTLFSPSISPPTPLSNTNGYLLRQFLAANPLPYAGAIFSAWGYSMLMTEELVVLCAVFIELLSLDSIEEYERVAGKEIQMGDCAPGRTGDVIKGEEVMRRLATVILGEDVRRDERRGVKIDRRKGLTIKWPQ